ncbi:hypothetical protein [Pontimicrobium sp. IMCC45349]|uniref:hypothetical protein n=1 Tax=Pontimicrobium sp. IMCC45349 TaxID=3391574 RepID=UPI0039A1D7DA
MDNKKHIDRLFQEKLKDFEAIPDSSVWDNINKELHKEDKERRVIPFWWRFGGVAAGLVLLITLGIGLQSDKETTNNNTNDSIVNTDVKEIKENTSVKEHSTEIINSSIEHESAIVTNNENANTVLKNKNSSKAIISANNKVDGSKLITPKNALTQNTSKNKNTLANNNIENNNNTSLSKESIKEIINNSTKAVGAVIANNETVSAKEELLKNDNEIDEDKEDLFEALEDKKDALTKEEEDKFKRWSVASNIAPVYFNTLGEGSSIHEQFNNNSKTGDINMSYGVSASYAVTKKLKVRTGINKVNLGYSTNNVVIYENIQPISLDGGDATFRNIKLNAVGANLSLISANTFSLALTPESLSNNLKASLDQKLGFIEVPLELEYNILDKKFGINVIGGFSALFLNDNEVYSVLEGESTLLGKATNINSTSYSANLGLGLDYKISKKLDLNLEPVFKYQINTFNNTSGDFRPYFIGIYSGLKFKF